MYDPDRIITFYNTFGSQEWERLDRSAHDRLVLHLHQHFLKEHIGPGKTVLDAGCGAGRFSISIAQSGSQVTLLDISETQIALAQEKIAKAGLQERAAEFVVGDILDLSRFDDHTFDTTVCYGGALNYLFEQAKQGMRELRRVTKPSGVLLVSVMSRWGVFRYTIGNTNIEPESFFGQPDYWMIRQVAETGDLFEHPELKHPPRHFFESKELESLFSQAGLEHVELGSTPSLAAGFYDRLEQMEQNRSAWQVLLELEEQAYRKPGLLDTGEHLMAKGWVPSLSGSSKRELQH
jgi:ubiquinone/menaquinone biosynthesis C-methylase UbiE